MKKTHLIYALVASICLLSCEEKNVTLPSYVTVTTDSITYIDTHSATVQISVEPTNITIQSMGVCYGTNANPNTLDKKVTLAKSGKNQVISITDLKEQECYYVRAFATTEQGVFYGKQLSFTTTEIKAPKVQTISVYNINKDNATCKAKLIDNGGDDRTRFGILIADHSKPTFNDRMIALSTECDSVKIQYLKLGNTYYVCSYAINQVDTVFGNELMFTTATPKKYAYQEGAVHGAFSVSKKILVSFANGNLQIVPSTKVWSFASKQYETCGNNNTRISASCNLPIDLFGYGTSGYNNVNPYQSTEQTSSYPSKDIANTEYDWGVYNAISNGGNKTGLWRTLTYKEWNYLIYERNNANNLIGLAIVNSVYGLMLLPDDWSSIEGIEFTASLSSYANTYTESEFEKMEQAGAVFLPRCGTRYKTSLMETSKGLYWTSTFSNSGSIYAAYLGFTTSGINASGTIKTCAGLSVRLVQDLEEAQ